MLLCTPVCTLFLKIHCRIFCVLCYKKSKLRILLRSSALLALQRRKAVKAHSFVLYFACRLCWQLISSTANPQSLIVKTRSRGVVQREEMHEGWSEAKEKREVLRHATLSTLSFFTPFGKPG